MVRRTVGSSRTPTMMIAERRRARVTWRRDIASPRQTRVYMPLHRRAQRAARGSRIDGERRYHAAKSLGLDVVPAIIMVGVLDEPNSAAPPLFQIHSQWSQWDAAMQCHALEPTYRELRSRFEDDDRSICTDDRGANRHR